MKLSLYRRQTSTILLALALITTEISAVKIKHSHLPNAGVKLHLTDATRPPEEYTQAYADSEIEGETKNEVDVEGDYDEGFKDGYKKAKTEAMPKPDNDSGSEKS